MKRLKEFLNENGYGTSTPEAMPNMGAVTNGDIASDVGTQTQSTFKTGTDLPDEDEDDENK